MNKKKKAIIELRNVKYEIPQVVFDEFKELVEERDSFEKTIDYLKIYIHNHTGTNAKA